MNKNNDQKKLTYISFSRAYDFDERGVLFTGKAIGTRVELTFEGPDLVEIEKSFHELVKAFLQMAGVKDSQQSETGVKTESPKQNEGETVIAIHLSDEIVRQINAYKKFRLIEEHIVQLIIEDNKRHQKIQEVRQFFEKWRFPKIVEVIPREDFSLKLRFEDGVEGEYDMRPSIQRGGEFAALADITLFRRVSIGDNGNYISWPDLIEVGVETIYWDLWGNSDWKVEDT